MMRSLFSAVSGLRAHQTKMDVIGNNIANVNTYGFKASRTTFADVYYQNKTTGTTPTSTRGGVNPTQIGYGSYVSSIDVLNTQSGPATTERPLDAYINGDGYFTVKNGDQTYYTRLGNLRFDPAGNLVDQNGNSIQGMKMVPVIKNAIPAIDETVGEYTYVDAGGATHTVIASEATTRVPGEKSTFYIDMNAVPLDVDSNKLDIYNIPAGSFLTVAAGKQAYVASIPAVPREVSWVLDNPPTTGVWAESDLEGINVKADMVGTPNILSILTNMSIGPDGTISGILTENFYSEKYGTGFRTNDTYVIGKLAIAKLTNAEGLLQVGDSYLQRSPNSGSAIYVEAGTKSTGSTLGAYLEMSNVDISKEFTDMITTQRGFQANTRIITVSDEMLQELVNLKR